MNENHAHLLIDKSPALTIPFDSINDLPTSKCILPHVVEQNVACSNLCVTEDRNQNLTVVQKEYLWWHFHLGHLGADTIQWVLRQPSFGSSHKIQTAPRCTPPKYAAYEYGKAHHRPIQAYYSTPSSVKKGAVKTNDVYPGSGVLVDYFVSKVPGCLYTSKGRSDVTEMYKGECMFVNQASTLIYVKHQIGFGALETIKIEQIFEDWACSHGVLTR